MIKAGGHQAAFDDSFMSNLTGRVYEWERDQDGRVWGPRDTDGMWDPNHPPTMSQDYTNNENYTSTASARRMAWPTSSVAWSTRPDAAQDFFLGNYDGSSQNLEERMDYLIGGKDGRTWDSGDLSDDGDGLGLALQAATVGEDTRTEDGTEIANEMFHNIAEYGGKHDGLLTNEWHVGPNMTDSLGLIASGYSPDLYNILHNSPPGASGDAALDSLPHLDIKPGELATFLGELGNSPDKTGMETLTTSMVAQCRNENLALLHDLKGPHTLLNLEGSGFSGLQEVNGDVMGNLLNYGTSLWDDNDKAAQARAEMMSKAISIAGGFVRAPAPCSARGRASSRR